MLLKNFTNFRTLSFAFVMVAMLMVGTMTPAHQTAAKEVNTEQYLALQEQINYLLQLIASLQAQLAANPETKSTIQKAEVCPYTWTRNLKIGDRGKDVQMLQRWLNQSADTSIVGIPQGEETTYYGNATAGAVSKFQIKYRADILSPHGLVNPTGYFGKNARAKIETLCSSYKTPDLFKINDFVAEVTREKSNFGPYVEFSWNSVGTKRCDVFMNGNKVLENRKSVGDNKDGRHEISRTVLREKWGDDYKDGKNKFELRCQSKYTDESQTISEYETLYIDLNDEQTDDTAEYRGYINGHNFIITKEITEVEAVNNCKLNAKNNPASKIYCTWDNKVIFDNRDSFQNEGNKELQAMIDDLLAQIEGKPNVASEEVRAGMSETELRAQINSLLAQLAQEKEEAPNQTQTAPQSNAYNCNRSSVNKSDGSADCYGMWDYGNAFGGDVDMCGSYSGATGCTIKASVCSSGYAKATDYYSNGYLKKKSDAALQTIANNLQTSVHNVKNEIAGLWSYSCTVNAQNSQATRDFWDLDNAGFVYVVGAYEGSYPNGERHSFGYHPQGEVTLNMTKQAGQSPDTVLILTAYEPVKWKLTGDAASYVSRVFLSGYYDQEIEGISDDVEVVHMSHQSKDSQYFYAYDEYSEKFKKLENYVEGKSGEKIYLYKGGYSLNKVNLGQKG